MFKSILVPIDGTDASDKAAQIARDLAGQYGASITFLYVATSESVSDEELRMVENEHLAEIERDMPLRADFGTASGAMAVPAFLGKASETNERVRNAIGRQLTAHAKDIAEDQGIEKADVRVENGNAADTIVRIAKETGVDAIIMGSRGRSDLAGLVLGSVSHAVASQAKCSVVTVH